MYLGYLGESVRDCLVLAVQIRKIGVMNMLWEVWRHVRVYFTSAIICMVIYCFQWLLTRSVSAFEYSHMRYVKCILTPAVFWAGKLQCPACLFIIFYFYYIYYYCLFIIAFKDRYWYITVVYRTCQQHIVLKTAYRTGHIRMYMYNVCIQYIFKLI